MKAIVLSAIPSSFSSRRDKSMGFRASTPELSTTEKVALMDLDGVNVRLLIEPTDFEIGGKVEVKSQIRGKTQSERLRAVLFCLWKKHQLQGTTEKTAEQFYMDSTESYINSIKEQLEP